ncbi:TPA: ATP-binding cassette domain-containing protein [Shigella sonnei]|nr:ATP-binding cassette domain-containing protein [Shigella sonnei]
MAGLKLQAVTKSWDGKTQVIKPLTLDVADGEFIVMVGPSGCGKSTLLRMVAGLERVTEGDIWINDQRVTEMEPKDRGIAMVFQNYALYPHMSVEENMAWGLKIRGMGKQQIAERVKEAARMSFIGSPAMNLLTGRVNNEGTHFELDGGIVLPLNGGYRQYAGRKMTLGIRPEHIALSSQAEGGVPLVMDTLEILGADNLAHGRWGEQKLVVRLAHQERPTAGSTLWLHLAENQLHLFDGETGQRV